MSAVLDNDSILAPGRPRLLGEPAAIDLRAHLQRYGPLPRLSAGRLIADVEAARLRGRGGAGFPTHVKLAAVARGRSRHLVVANGTEGEPASWKDRTLISRAPHLVIDGMVAAAVGLGAESAVLCIERRQADVISAARRALSERGRRDPVAVTIAETPARYIAGEETALVSWLKGGPAKPAFSPSRPSDMGILVDNVETLANLALIARFGPASYRLAGSDEEPGTTLLTVRGDVTQPGTYEHGLGTPLAEVLSEAGASSGGAVLVGGYFGLWLTSEQAGAAIVSTRGDVPIGCGLVAVMPPSGHCPLQEVSSVLRWLAANSAGQCGPCVNGLPALASSFEDLLSGDPDGLASKRLDRWAPMVIGRGACKLPDGAVRFLTSARRTFADHIECHRRGGPCPPNSTVLLPVTALGAWR